MTKQNKRLRKKNPVKRMVWHIICVGLEYLTSHLNKAEQKKGKFGNICKLRMLRILLTSHLKEDDIFYLDRALQVI